VFRIKTLNDELIIAAKTQKDFDQWKKGFKNLQKEANEKREKLLNTK
jgi:hypothetical protein